ncbi:MAG: gliding motility lipoprotein GldH [Thermoflexibacter sp.]|jgi:gliding motility-associated lipoprotein GldH|nr:gliding motility lipoprotein GldH [Thermoflexibacter sp.]
MVNFQYFKKTFFPIFLLIWLSSCDSTRLFEEYKDLPERKWRSAEAITFNFQITDTVQSYNLYYNIRNTLSYPYYNLYITYELLDGADKVIAQKMLQNNLMHPQTGEPYGDGIGDLFDHRFVLLSDYKFSQSGSYKLRLRQYMRMNELPEIVAVGMRIEKAKE